MKVPEENASPVDPTSANPVMVAPNIDISSRNDPIERSTTKKSALVPFEKWFVTKPSRMSSAR